MPADVLVLGAGGTFGHVAARLLSQRYEVIAAGRERSRDIRIILLSAFTCPELEQEARLRGADAVLRKPRPLSEVASCLLDLLEGGR